MNHNNFNLKIENEPLNLEQTKLSLYENCVTIYELDDYEITNRQATKKLGQRIGIYHPLISNVFVLDKFEWQLYDTFSQSPSMSVKQLKQMYQGKLSELMDTLQMFLEYRLILPDTEDLCVDIQSENKATELYVKLTEKCNFSCSGCATASDITPLPQAQSLDLTTILFFLEHFGHDCVEKGFSQANIKWAGGEPLLNKSYRVIVAVQDTIQKLQNLYPDVDIEQTILTNGVFLNDEKIKFALEHNIHLAISLWGTELYQDAVRRPRSQKETFPAIIENIRQLHKAETRFNVNYVLTPDNALDFPDFLSMMWDVEHPSFIGRNGRNKQPIPLGINFFRPQSLAQLKSIAKSYQVMENGLRLGFARTLNMIKRGINIQPLRTIDYLNLFNLTTIPCGAGFSYLAMGVHGVAPCHEGLFMMKSNLERIKQGENMFDLASEYFKGEQELLHSPNITFEKGQNLMFHGGQGCPRLAKKENNGKLGVAASTSKFYNAIYEELLSLETMRQLYRE